MNNSLSELLASGLDPVTALWYQFVDALPTVLAAIIIFVIGWAVAAFVGWLVRRALQFAGADSWIDRSSLRDDLKLGERASRLSVPKLAGKTVKWLLLLGTLAIVFEAINLPQVSQFIGEILAYLPNVIVAIVILALGFVAARFVADLIETGIDASRLPVQNPRVLATVARYSILLFAVLAALTQLHIVPELIQIFFAGLVLALALAFGLGGREHASDWIRQMRERA